MSIRNAAKALIINDNKILMIKCQNTVANMLEDLPIGAIYYDLPGGGQNQYETLEEAVKRECLEETGYTIAVEKLAAVYEEILTNEDFRTKWGDYAHKVHFLFACRIDDELVKTPSETDLDMVEAVWIDISDVTADFPWHPKIIRDSLERVLEFESTLYLGSAYY